MTNKEKIAACKSVMGDDALLRSQRRAEALQIGIYHRVITRHDLDSPHRTEAAFRVLLNEALRSKKSALQS